MQALLFLCTQISSDFVGIMDGGTIPDDQQFTAGKCLLEVLQIADDGFTVKGLLADHILQTSCRGDGTGYIEPQIDFSTGGYHRCSSFRSIGVGECRNHTDT